MLKIFRPREPTSPPFLQKKSLRDDHSGHRQRCGHGAQKNRQEAAPDQVPRCASKNREIEHLCGKYKNAATLP